MLNYFLKIYYFKYMIFRVFVSNFFSIFFYSKLINNHNINTNPKDYKLFKILLIINFGPYKFII